MTALLCVACVESRYEPTSEPLTCDATLPACQEAIYFTMTDILGVWDEQMPLVRTISVEEYRAELDERYEPEQVEEGPWTIAWRLLGFIPNNATTITDNVIERNVENIWGFYSPTTKEVTVIDRDYELGELNQLLAHEFVHAIQDLQFGFDQIWENTTTEDQFVATRSVIEGDAVNAQWWWFFEVEGIRFYPEDWADWHEDRKSWLLDQVHDREVRFLDTVFFFPYVHGFEFMTDATFDQGFSLAREVVWESPPRSTEAIMRGYQAFREGTPEPGPFLPAHPAPVPGYEVADESPMGMWYAYAFLIRAGMDERDALEIASHMSSDSLGTYQGGSDIAAVWRLELESPDAATLVKNVVNLATPPVAWEARAEGGDVFIIAAEHHDALAAWTAQPLDSVTPVVATKSARRRPPWPAQLETCIHP